MKYFWTINVTRTEHDWMARMLPKILPKNRDDKDFHIYPKHWTKELDPTERMDVRMIVDGNTGESWLELTFSSDGEPIASLATIDLDETMELDVNGDMYYVNVNTPVHESVDVNQRPVSVSYVCPTCGYEGEIPYDTFCDDHGDPTDWDTFECGECGQAILIESQEWC